MIDIQANFSPWNAHKQLQQERAQLHADHCARQAGRVRLCAAPNNAWRRDHFVAATTYHARNAVCTVQVAVVYVKKPIAYVVGVIAEAALFASLVLVCGSVALVDYGVSKLTGQNPFAHVHLGLNFCLFCVYAPIKLVDEVSSSVIDCVVVAVAAPLGAMYGALTYAAGSQAYLHAAPTRP